jgi:hypothetical protein
MKLTVKTLKGSKFEVDCEPSNTVLEVKGIVVSSIVAFFVVVLFDVTNNNDDRNVI